MYLYDTIKYIEYLDTQKEIKEKGKLEDYKMKLLITHSSDPQKLFNELKKSEGDNINNDIGDFQSLDKLRTSRGVLFGRKQYN